MIQCPRRRSRSNWPRPGGWRRSKSSSRFASAARSVPFTSIFRTERTCLRRCGWRYSPTSGPICFSGGGGRLALRRLALPSARRSPPRGLGGARPGVSSREIRRREGPGPLGHPQEPGVAPSRQEGASSGVSPSQTRTRHIAATLMSRVAAMIPKTQSHPFGTASESQPKNQA